LGLSKTEDRARADSCGETGAPAALARSLIRPERDNLVARPWGGQMLERFKRLPAVPPAGGPFGEAFEISACASDPEARQFPSLLRQGDGSRQALPDLLAAHGEMLLGAAFWRRHGTCFPLLPKTLSVRELLSVQGHPEGNTEVYIVIDAEPGATLRLGFRRDLDRAVLEPALTRGLARQGELLVLLGPGVDVAALQAVARPWFADRDVAVAALVPWLESHVAQATSRRQASEHLTALKALYWQVLDALNEIPVHPGQVIYNSTPARLRAGRAASAEVHALGNPEGREILALEIRRPGPTFRAWDNVRFPRREVDVKAALAALNLRATQPEEFIVERVPVPGRPGAAVSVDCEYFRVEHLKPAPGRPVAAPAAGPHTLHCIAGSARVIAGGDRDLGVLERGDSALVPVLVGAYRVATESSAELVRVTLPET
jgi:mannose-6-phosphate isomerase class I